MKTELDKCMAGEWYDCHDPIFITQKGTARQKRQPLLWVLFSSALLCTWQPDAGCGHTDLRDR